MSTNQCEITQPLYSVLPSDSDLLELVDDYVSGLQETANAIEQRLALADFEGLRILVHRLKGSAGAYGFPTITDAAAIVERAIKTSQLSAVPPLTTNVIALCRSASRSNHGLAL